MSLIEQAELDLEEILENTDDFGINLKFIDENLIEYEVVGSCSDIGFFFDPETGVGVVGRKCNIVVRIRSLNDLNAGYPDKNWKCIYTDTNNIEWTTAIAEKPTTDRTLGVYFIMLEAMEK